MVFGHLEVLHSKFHGRTISNLGDYVAQTDRQTNKQTDKQTDKAIYIVDLTSYSFYPLSILSSSIELLLTAQYIYVAYVSACMQSVQLRPSSKYYCALHNYHRAHHLS